MWSRVELINRVMEDVLEDHQKSISETGELTLTVMEARRLVEKTVEETKKHIAKKLVESRKDTIEVLACAGCFGVTDDGDVEELVLDALGAL